MIIGLFLCMHFPHTHIQAYWLLEEMKKLEFMMTDLGKRKQEKDSGGN